MSALVLPLKEQQPAPFLHFIRRGQREGRSCTSVDQVVDGRVVVLDVADRVDKVAVLPITAAKVAVVKEEDGPSFFHKASSKGLYALKILLGSLQDGGGEVVLGVGGGAKGIRRVVG